MTPVYLALLMLPSSSYNLIVFNIFFLNNFQSFLRNCLRIFYNSLNPSSIGILLKELFKTYPVTERILFLPIVSPSSKDIEIGLWLFKFIYILMPKPNILKFHSMPLHLNSFLHFPNFSLHCKHLAQIWLNPLLFISYLRITKYVLLNNSSKYF